MYIQERAINKLCYIIIYNVHMNIVIATNNGMLMLPHLLKSFEEKNVKHPIYIVDTISTDPKFIDYLDNLNYDLNITVEKLSEPLREIACLYHVYEKYQLDDYFYMHDSFILKDPKIFGLYEEIWEAKKDTIGCIAWNTFHSTLEGDKKQIVDIFKVEDKPFMGIFGSILYTKKYVLDVLAKNGKLDFRPREKADCGIMEWASARIFDVLGYEVVSFHPTNTDLIRCPYLLKMLSDRDPEWKTHLHGHPNYYKNIIGNGI